MESIREHYALTLRRWVANLESDWATAVRLVSPGRARVWQLYMAASALAFERNRIGVNQVLAVKRPTRAPPGCRCGPACGARPAGPDPRRPERAGPPCGSPALGASRRGEITRP